MFVILLETKLEKVHGANDAFKQSSQNMPSKPRALDLPILSGTIFLSLYMKLLPLVPIGDVVFQLPLLFTSISIHVFFVNNQYTWAWSHCYAVGLEETCWRFIGLGEGCIGVDGSNEGWHRHKIVQELEDRARVRQRGQKIQHQNVIG
jgi:hypothetical protein